MLPSYVWAFKLTTSSAAPTITIGGSFLVNKAAYNSRLPYCGVTLLQTSSPRRGDIVQFRHPDLPIIGAKRVIGLPGETLEFRENRVIIDGHVLPLRPLNRAEFDWVAPLTASDLAFMRRTATGSPSRRAKASTVPINPSASAHMNTSSSAITATIV